MNDTPTPAIRWKLRDVMASAGMFQTTELREPLRRHGVKLSREQVFRLVTKPPERLNMTVLAALCQVFSCSPNDLIEPVEVAAAPAPRVVGDTVERDLPELRPVKARIHRPTDGPV